MNINAIIIEDEAPAARRLEALLRESAADVRVVTVLESVAGSAAWLTSHPSPDLIFMDVQLSDGISFEIFDAVPVPCPVIFTTAFDEYALRAFKVNSIDYLVKPIDREELARAMDKFRRLRGERPQIDLRAVIRSILPEEQAYRSRFLIPVADTLVSIPIEEVAFFHSTHDIVSLVTISGNKYSLNTPLDVLEREVDPKKYFRANRQFLVSYKSIISVHVYFAGKLKVNVRGSNDEVIVSREKASAFKEWLGS